MKTKTFIDKTLSNYTPHYPDTYIGGITREMCEGTESWLSELCEYTKMCPHDCNPDTCPELITECDYLIAEIRANVKRRRIH